MANAFKRQTSSAVGTVITAVGGYTVPAATQVTVIGLVLANVAATAINVNVTLYNGTTDTYLVKSCPVPVGGSAVVIGGDQKVVMQAGDSMRVLSDTASSVDVVMSILEIT